MRLRERKTGLDGQVSMETAQLKTEWLRVKRDRPCPICGRKDWCLVAADGSAAICARTESQKRAGKAGWLHRLEGAHRLPPRTAPRRTAPGEEASAPDFVALMRRWDERTPVRSKEEYAAALGVAPWTIRDLGAAKAPEHNAWAWPMRDADGEIIGIRLRNAQGEKWAVTGSHNGLFIPRGVPSDQGDTILICEGPTTCAALRSLNYDVIGRASCSTCVDLCAELVRRERLHVVIVGDEDDEKKRPGGSSFWPGQEGAAALANALTRAARSVKVIFPLTGKDARDAIRTGATREVIDCQIRSALLWRPPR